MIWTGASLVLDAVVTLYYPAGTIAAFQDRAGAHLSIGYAREVPRRTAVYRNHLICDVTGTQGKVGEYHVLTRGNLLQLRLTLDNSKMRGVIKRAIPEASANLDVILLTATVNNDGEIFRTDGWQIPFP